MKLSKRGKQLMGAINLLIGLGLGIYMLVLGYDGIAADMERSTRSHVLLRRELTAVT